MPDIYWGLLIIFISVGILAKFFWSLGNHIPGTLPRYCSKCGCSMRELSDYSTTVFSPETGVGVESWYTYWVCMKTDKVNGYESLKDYGGRYHDTSYQTYYIRKVVKPIQSECSPE